MSKKNSKVSKKTGKATSKASKAKAPAKPEINPTVEIITGQQLPKAKAKATAKTAAKPQRPSGLNAAVQVLKDAGEPMRCKDMVAKMLDSGLWKTDGKTPAATINAAIHREITTKGDKSRFKKTDRGLFDLA